MKANALHDPVRAMRSLALATPLVLILILAIVGAIRAVIDGAAFTLRLDGATTGGLAGLAVAFATIVSNCRDEAQFRAARNWLFAAFALLVATAAAITAIRGDRWGATAGFSVAALMMALFASVFAHARWLTLNRGGTEAG